MKSFLIVLVCCFTIVVPANALEIEAPAVPERGREWMPVHTDSIQNGLSELFQKVLGAIHPDIFEASKVSLAIVSAVLMLSILQDFSSSVQKTAEMCGTVVIASVMLTNTNSMICLASNTIQEIGNYGVLLLPVMTGALAAQGSVTTSGALYAGTALFNSVLQAVIGNVLMPGVYLFLGLCIGSNATGEILLKKIADLIKNSMSWFLKILLIIFTTYLSLSGVISGTTDAAALKAAKVGMSTFIPVVGSVLSDASEAVLISAGLMKNAAGIYGIIAVLALFLHPFLKLAAHYLILKLTGGICGIFGSTRITGIIDAFGTAMGLLLGMTGASCIMVLISTVCFMKGAT